MVKLASIAALGCIIGGCIGIAALYFSVDLLEGIEPSWSLS